MATKLGGTLDAAAMHEADQWPVGPPPDDDEASRPDTRRMPSGHQRW